MAGDDDELLTIGEVAKLDGITAKALRYYDAHNILKPAAVDPATGYRLPATGYRLPATGYRLPATGYRLPATDTTPPIKCLTSM